jgi:hypothetical protein
MLWVLSGQSTSLLADFSERTVFVLLVSFDAAGLSFDSVGKTFRQLSNGFKIFLLCRSRSVPVLSVVKSLS